MTCATQPVKPCQHMVCMMKYLLPEQIKIASHSCHVGSKTCLGAEAGNDQPTNFFAWAVILFPSLGGLPLAVQYSMSSFLESVNASTHAVAANTTTWSSLNGGLGNVSFSHLRPCHVQFVKIIIASDASKVVQQCCCFDACTKLIMPNMQPITSVFLMIFLNRWHSKL